MEAWIDFDYATLRARTSAGALQNKTNCVLHCTELVLCSLTISYAEKHAENVENFLGTPVVSEALKRYQGHDSLTRCQVCRLSGLAMSPMRSDFLIW